MVLCRKWHLLPITLLTTGPCHHLTRVSLIAGFSSQSFTHLCFRLSVMSHNSCTREINIGHSFWVFKSYSLTHRKLLLPLLSCVVISGCIGCNCLQWSPLRPRIFWFKISIAAMKRRCIIHSASTILFDSYIYVDISRLIGFLVTVETKESCLRASQPGSWIQAAQGFRISEWAFRLSFS